MLETNFFCPDGYRCATAVLSYPFQKLNPALKISVFLKTMQKKNNKKKNPVTNPTLNAFCDINQFLVF